MKVQNWMGRLFGKGLGRKPNRTILRLESLEERTVPAVIVWDGGGTDNKASTKENWVGDVKPVSGDEAVFNNTNPTKDCTFDIALTTTAQDQSYITVDKGYTGKVTFTQNQSLQGLKLRSGAVAGAAAISVVTGGIFEWMPGATLGGGALDGGTINLAGNSTGTIGQGNLTINGWVLNNAGALTWGGGTINITGGGVLNTNGTFTVIV